MTEHSYLGGIVSRSRADCDLPDGNSNGGCVVWDWAIGNHRCFFHHSRNGFATFKSEDGGVLVRGYVRDLENVLGGCSSGDQICTAEEIWQSYCANDELRLDKLDGCFTIVIVDARLGRFLVFRNFVGTGSTFYEKLDNGFVFASNLRRLVDSTGAATPNKSILPVFFTYRFVPGRETLFQGVRKLIPGEMLRFDQGGLTLSQRQYFSNPNGGSLAGSEAVDRLEETMSSVLEDCYRLDPRAANLLSGGVDSSYIQAIWNQNAKSDSLRPSSIDIAVKHERTHADQQYAISASNWLGTSHDSIEMNAPYERYLVESIAATGEPPNHVQSVYFLQAARSMVGQGLKTGLCGEGADSLLGSSSVTVCRRAELIRKVIPIAAVQRLLARVSGACGRDIWQASFKLSSCIDDFSDKGHLVNQVAVFSHYESVAKCFNEELVDSAFDYRRSLIDDYGVEKNILHYVHAAGFLGEAMETASAWTIQFEHEGANMFCPYMDSRLIRIVMEIDSGTRFSYGNPKRVLKEALGRHVCDELVNRPKLGFGQPIFEWMSENGQLRPLIDRIGSYDFVGDSVLQLALKTPNWFLYSLLCYDIWFKLFIEKSLVHEPTH